MFSFKPNLSDWLNDLNPSLGEEALLTALGYRKDTAPSEVVKRGQELLDLAKECLRLRLVLKDTAVSYCNEKSIVGGNLVIRSEKWALVGAKMQGPRMGHIFILTLGPVLDELINDKVRKSVFEAYLLDTIGSLLIENSAGNLEKEIRKLAKMQARQISRRFSPGYCDWDLSTGQQDLFRFLEPEGIGVQFLGVGAMKPAKTISGVILSADRVLLKCPCSLCDRRECAHRRV